MSPISSEEPSLKILTTQETTALARMLRKWNPLMMLVGKKTGAATLENSMEVPQKVKNRSYPITQKLHY